MKKRLLSTLALAAGMMLAVAQPKASHCAGSCPQGDALEKAVQETLAKMTVHEKVQLLHAQSKFTSAGVPRLGIPELSMSDGHIIQFLPDGFFTIIWLRNRAAPHIIGYTLLRKPLSPVYR